MELSRSDMLKKRGNTIFHKAFEVREMLNSANFYWLFEDEQAKKATQQLFIIYFLKDHKNTWFNMKTPIQIFR